MSYSNYENSKMTVGQAVVDMEEKVSSNKSLVELIKLVKESSGLDKVILANFILLREESCE